MGGASLQANKSSAQDITYSHELQSLRTLVKDIRDAVLHSYLQLILGPILSVRNICKVVISLAENFLVTMSSPAVLLHYEPGNACQHTCNYKKASPPPPPSKPVQLNLSWLFLAVVNIRLGLKLAVWQLPGGLTQVCNTSSRTNVIQ